MATLPSTFPDRQAWDSAEPHVVAHSGLDALLLLPCAFLVYMPLLFLSQCHLDELTTCNMKSYGNAYPRARPQFLLRVRSIAILPKHLMRIRERLSLPGMRNSSI